MAENEIGSIAKTFGDAYKKFGTKARLSNFLFRSIAQKGKAENIPQMDIQKAREWFRDEALKKKRANANEMIEDAGAFEKMDRLSANSIGKMYITYYSPKYKDDKKKLPYWDKFPLIFPIEFYNNGSMLAMNLHYLPPVARAKLMNALYETLNNEKYNKTTKLKISYEILKGSSKFKEFRHCVKKYLFSHFQAPFTVVKNEFWDYALMLPTDQFNGASRDKVWKDSMSKL